MIKLILYVRGRDDQSGRVIQSVRDVCSSLREEDVELDVIDLDEEPHAAVRDGVLATPMLMRRSPPLGRKLIGDLCERSSVLEVIGGESCDLARSG